MHQFFFKKKDNIYILIFTLFTLHVYLSLPIENVNKEFFSFGELHVCLYMWKPSNWEKAIHAM